MFLGLDLSTQSLTATVVGPDAAVSSHSVSFADRLALPGGFERDAVDPLRVTAPVRIWIAALDALLTDLAAANVPLGEVRAIGGCAQQHAFVAWAVAELPALDAELPLAEQLPAALAVADSPIWMDASTRTQCERFEAAAGGAHELAARTGSRAYERFTGPQMLKELERPDRRRPVRKWTLASNALASILAGRFVPADFADASGMNLLDIETQRFVPALAQGLLGLAEGALDEPVRSGRDMGHVSAWLVERHGFSRDCRIHAFTGDNPATIVGLGAREAGDVVVSLGSSDTLIALAGKKPQASTEGHVFCSPLEDAPFMLMYVYTGGDAIRRGVCDEVCGGSWDKWDRLIAETEPGNGGVVTFAVGHSEITPNYAGAPRRVHRDAASGAAREIAAGARLVRGIVESRALSMLGRARARGIAPRRLILAGGASRSAGIAQVFADVFGVDVFVAPQSAVAASLGGAIMAGAAAPADRLRAAAPACAQDAYRVARERYLDLEREALGP